MALMMNEFPSAFIQAHQKIAAMGSDSGPQSSTWRSMAPNIWSCWKALVFSAAEFPALQGDPPITKLWQKVASQY